MTLDRLAEDLRTALETISGENLKAFFRQIGLRISIFRDRTEMEIAPFVGGDLGLDSAERGTSFRGPETRSNPHLF